MITPYNFDQLYTYIKINKDIYERGCKLASAIPQTISKSILNGAGRLAAGLSEVSFTTYLLDCLKYEVSNNEQRTRFTGDVLVRRNKKFNPFLIEIKCTQRTCLCEPDYHVHVAASQIQKQKKAKYFAFCSLHYRYKTEQEKKGKYQYHEPQGVEILGIYEGSKIEKDFKFRYKGEKGDDNKPAIWDEYYTQIQHINSLPIWKI